MGNLSEFLFASSDFAGFPFKEKNFSKEEQIFPLRFDPAEKGTHKNDKLVFPESTPIQINVK